MLFEKTTVLLDQEQLTVSGTTADCGVIQPGPLNTRRVHTCNEQRPSSGSFPAFSGNKSRGDHPGRNEKTYDPPNAELKERASRRVSIAEMAKKPITAKLQPVTQGIGHHRFASEERPLP